MKFGILILLIVCCSAVTKPTVDQYYITFIKGKAVLAKTKQTLKIGDVLTGEDKIIFDVKSSKISCINAVRGRFDIKPVSSKSGGENELFAILKSGLIPAASNYSLSTRSIVFEGYDPAIYFAATETQGRVLVFEQQPFLIKSLYKLDESNFFFIQFEENGIKTTKRIRSNGQNLFFSKDNFIATNGQPAQSVSLCYQTYENGHTSSSIVVDFQPAVTTVAEIEIAVSLIKKIYIRKDKKEIKSAIINHLLENYGKIGAEELSKIL